MPDSHCLVSTIPWLVVGELLLESEIAIWLFHLSTPLLQSEAVVCQTESVELWHLKAAVYLT